MSTLIIYDSEYGNTDKIANAIAVGAAEVGEVVRKKASDVRPTDLDTVDLVLWGSPTQGGRPTGAMQALIQRLSSDILRGVSVAAFDTRLAIKEHGRWLGWLMKTIGFAAPKIASELVRKGAKLVTQPQGFIVSDKEGPLKEGELERARQWARELAFTTSRVHVHNT